MKLLYTFATVLSFLAVVHAAPEDTAVTYNDGSTVDITDSTLCIPLHNKGMDVLIVSFGVNVKCNTYASKDCSGSSLNSTPLSFEAPADATPDEFDQAFPNGSFKCT